jgi:hypothetical protein
MMDEAGFCAMCASKGESMLGRGGAAAPARFGIPSTLTSSLARIRAPAELLAAMAAARFLAPT